jgi:hypothetical protein
MASSVGVFVWRGERARRQSGACPATQVLIPQTLFDVGAGPSVDALVAEACKQVSAALQKLVVPAKSTM